MPKRGREGAAKPSKAKRQATEEAKYMRGVDRAVARYGASAVAKYYSPKGELKGVDTALTIAGPVLSTTNTNGDCFVLNLVVPGTGSWNRIGRKIRMQSARLRGQAAFTYSPVTTTLNLVDNVLRMVMVYDKNPNSGTIPTFDTIFGVTAPDGTESSNMYAPLRYDNTDRFSVVCDHLIDGKMEATPFSTGTGNLVTNLYTFDKYVKLRGLSSQFSGQSSPQTIADISSGALYVFFRANTALSTSGWAISSTSFCRLRYEDQ